MAFFPELFPLPDMVTDPRNFLFSPKPQHTGEEEWEQKKIGDNANEETRPRRFPQRRRSATKSRKTEKQSQRAQPSPEQEHILNWQQKSQPIACLHADRQ
jgi:hypothetical protein